MKLTHLPTPAALLDEARLRPHVKTAKCLPVAQLQLAAGAQGITVSTLKEAGLPCPEVSVGSTPTALSPVQLEGVTEVRAGVYVFNDLVMHGVGVCSTDEIALSVLCTVIGHQQEKGWVLVDAGWMAMSRDRGTHDQTVDCGYGAVCDEQGALIDGFIMSGANQEHGVLSWRDGRADAHIATRWPVGTRLRVLPNHACATAAQFPHYDVLAVDGNLQRWPRFYGNTSTPWRQGSSAGGSSGGAIARSGLRHGADRAGRRHRRVAAHSRELLWRRGLEAVTRAHLRMQTWRAKRRRACASAGARPR